MRYLDVIRAWKDEEYRLGLSEAERALLPAHPAGLVELTEEDMNPVAGGEAIFLEADANAHTSTTTTTTTLTTTTSPVCTSTTTTTTTTTTTGG
jgi:mersacidin/lichenicidin family type 2 lantibiotic